MHINGSFAMRTLILILFIALSASIGTLPAQAQNNSRAYAPENIGQLSVSDQIRVIEKEYSEQSRGRSIPDDQLEFYLDQIRVSRWTFSRIKTDIATSLRGNGNGNSSGGGGSWQPPPGGTWNPSSVICSSDGQRYRECRTPFQGRPRLIENISHSQCVEGRNWGSRQGLVWVSGGCRGRFIDSGNSWNGGSSNNQRFQCASDSGRYRECRKPYSSTVYLARQLSSGRCIEGTSWGQKRDLVWVSGGCRGEFGIRGGNGSGGNNGYNVTCTSFNGRLTTCAWDRSRGTPRLIQRIAGQCSERYDWGYDNRGLWVSNNCSARFGVR